MKILAIIPAYQEERFIADVVRRTRAVLPDVLVIDDGSTDATAERAREAGARVALVRPNRGKGHALGRGFAAALEEGFDAVAQLDADGQHAPEDLPAMIETLHRSGAGIVLGVRARGGTAMPWLRRQVNASCSALVSMLTGTRVPDVHSGFRLIRRAVLQRIDCRTATFDFEVDFLVRAARAAVRIVPAPVRTVYGTERSHIDRWTDTLKFFRIIGYHAFGVEVWRREIRTWTRPGRRPG